MVCREVFRAWQRRVHQRTEASMPIHQIPIDEDTIPLTAFCTPNRLFEWLVMPQGSSASPGWFVKVTNEVMKGVEREARDVCICVWYVCTVHSLETFVQYQVLVIFRHAGDSGGVSKAPVSPRA